MKEALERFPGKIALAWTGGKDSTTTLHLLKDLCGGEVPIPILNIDTSVKFKEIYDFRDRVAAEWGLNLLIERNDEALKEIKIAEDKGECCFRLKAEVIAQDLRTGAALMLASLVVQGETSISDYWQIERGYDLIWHKLNRLTS